MSFEDIGTMLSHLLMTSAERRCRGVFLKVFLVLWAPQQSAIEFHYITEKTDISTSDISKIQWKNNSVLRGRSINSTPLLRMLKGVHISSILVMVEKDSQLTPRVTFYCVVSYFGSTSFSLIEKFWTWMNQQ